ncbi:hypothetical protein HQ545_00490 [Candidatus Woesearchaeota archaeon]|nr:hypothetical protein [Candidatus Woesearchaeota archaeon]
MRSKTMRRSDWILALLFSPGQTSRKGEPIEGTIRLMKELFLLKQKISSVSYTFVPYDYGPCSFEVYDDISSLKKTKLIKTIAEPRNEYPIYRLTEEGFKEVKSIYDEFDTETKKALLEIKKDYNQMPLSDLILYVYEKYNSYATKTIINLELLRGIHDINSGN